MKTTIKIVTVLVLGVFAGLLFIPSEYYDLTSTLLDIGLCLLLFFVGIDIGQNTEVFSKLKAVGIKLVLIPLGAILGSILGGLIIGLILGYAPNQGAAVGAGMGWYTLAPILIAPYSAELSAIAFLTNVIREIIAIISIPLIASKIGYLESIACSGATAMDTTLPIITNNTNEEVAVVSFISGVIMSLSVPVLVSFFIAL